MRFILGAVRDNRIHDELDPARRLPSYAAAVPLNGVVLSSRNATSVLMLCSMVLLVVVRHHEQGHDADWLNRTVWLRRSRGFIFSLLHPIRRH